MMSGLHAPEAVATTAPHRLVRPRPDRRTEPRCTVGLLTWNAEADAIACLRGVLAQTETPLDWIWIDNASADRTRELVRGQFPDLPAPLLNPVNLGFCAPHNQALRACRTPYYLALNQDVILEAGYVERLCDWMDEQPDLALVSGLILMPPEPGWDGEPPGPPRIHSAGLAIPRNGFPYELGLGHPIRPADQGRRITPGVTGAAMLLRVEACCRVSQPPDDVFPADFFAYSEEVDLALRLARAGLRCGVDGTALATHRGRGSGGYERVDIRAKYFANHWIALLRQRSWTSLLRDLPFLLGGLLRLWLPLYWEHPRAFGKALADIVWRAPAARRFYRRFEQSFGPTAAGLRAYQDLSLRLLRDSRAESGEKRD